jgi:hypothetical protein
VHALQEPPTSPSGPGTSTPHRSRWRTARCVIGVIGGMLWWGALLLLAVRPAAVGGPGSGFWHSALTAGGWSLGLIPLHAVPVRLRRDPRGDAPAV